MLAKLLDIFFPPVCALCDSALSKGEFCPGCMEELNKHAACSPLCPRCGAAFPKETGQDHVCGQCLAEEMPFIAARSAFIYDGRPKDAVHGLKYRAQVILAAPLGSLMAKAAVFPQAPDVVMPVPLHKKRLKERGFNQALLLGREVSKALSIELDYANLRKTRETLEQVDLSAEERKKNVAGAFEVARPGDVKGKKVLLIDDVYTTGATIKECSKALKGSGAWVYVLTLARAAKL